MKRNILKAIICMFLILATVATPISASASSMAYIMKVNAYDVRMREEAGDSEVVAKFDKGDKVVYWGEREGSYYKVGTASGETGYIYKDYLSAYGTVKKSMLYYTDERTDFYRKSGSSLRRNGSLSADVLLIAFQRNGDWAYVKTLGGKSGFVKLSEVESVF